MMKNSTLLNQLPLSWASFISVLLLSGLVLSATGLFFPFPPTPLGLMPPSDDSQGWEVEG